MRDFNQLKSNCTIQRNRIIPTFHVEQNYLPILNYYYNTTIMNNEINYLNEIELALNVNFIKVIWNDKIKFKTVKIDNCFKCFFGTKNLGYIANTNDSLLFIDNIDIIQGNVSEINTFINKVTNHLNKKALLSQISMN